MNMELPYDLTEERLVLENLSHDKLQRGELLPGEIIAELVDWGPDEIERVLWGTVALCVRNIEGWIGEGNRMSRHPLDYILMAMDTAMVWERG